MTKHFYTCLFLGLFVFPLVVKAAFTLPPLPAELQPEPVVRALQAVKRIEATVESFFAPRDTRNYS